MGMGVLPSVQKPLACVNILQAWNAGSEKRPRTPFKALPLAAASVAVATAAAVIRWLVTAAVCGCGTPWASSLKFVDVRRRFQNRCSVLRAERLSLELWRLQSEKLPSVHSDIVPQHLG